MTRKEFCQNFPGFDLAVGGPQDADDCLALRTAVSEELKAEEREQLCLARETPDEFRNFFADPTARTLVLRTDSRELVGFGIALCSGESRDRFRALIPDFDAAPNYVAYVKLIQVAKKYRGHGLQRLFFAELEDLLYREGSRYAVGTVSPDNAASLTNFKRRGYQEAERFIVQPLGYERTVLSPLC